MDPSRLQRKLRKQIQLPKRRIVLNLTNTVDNVQYNFIINKIDLLQTFRGSLT
jgi:hypothetical protein